MILSLDALIEGMSGRLLFLRSTILGLSQGEFGEYIGYTPTHVSQVERGLATPSKGYIKGVCHAFKVSEKWLVNGEGQPFEINTLRELRTLLERGGADRLAEAFTALMKEARFFAEALPPPLDPIEDARLRQIVMALREAWRDADDDMKGWITVQFRNTFPGLLAALEKKRAVAGEGPRPGA